MQVLPKSNDLHHFLTRFAFLQKSSPTLYGSHSEVVMNYEKPLKTSTNGNVT